MLLNTNKITDPLIEIYQIPSNVFEFKNIFFWMHFFDSIRIHRDFIKKTFFDDLLTKKFRKIFISLPTNAIGVHIRRGDFAAFKHNQKFDREVVLVQTPIDYFVQTIKLLRYLSGKDLKAVIFSDGYESELTPVLGLPNVELFKGKSDLEDMLALSKCKIIIPSPSSTFGLFAGFISDSILLHHPDFFMRDIRPEEVNKIHFEGPFNYKSENDIPSQLIRQLKEI